MKVVYKIFYPNRKTYIGKDLTDDINYFGSACRALIAEDFIRAERRRFSVVREILWESESAGDQEVAAVEFALIRQYRSNDPRFGYNRSPPCRTHGSRESVRSRLVPGELGR